MENFEQESSKESESFTAQIMEQRRRAKELGLTLRDGQPVIENQYGKKGKEIFEQMQRFLDAFEHSIDFANKEFDQITAELYE